MDTKTLNLLNPTLLRHQHIYQPLKCEESEELMEDHGVLEYLLQDHFLSRKESIF